MSITMTSGASVIAFSDAFNTVARFADDDEVLFGSINALRPMRTTM